MPSVSKEENVLKCILENSPLREWHFEEIVRTAKVTRAVANKWLKKYVDKGLLNHVREKRKFPYFTVGKNNQFYHSLKRVYALNELHKCGLIPKLLSLKDAKTVIIFGSIARGDWYEDSDIDIFIFGNPTDFNRQIYEERLHRSIELHTFHTKKDIEKVKSGLIENVVNGYIVKGRIQDFADVA
jgi:predicted nucleotidyltransferase